MTGEGPSIEQRVHPNLVTVRKDSRKHQNSRLWLEEQMLGKPSNLGTDHHCPTRDRYTLELATVLVTFLPVVFVI